MRRYNCFLITLAILFLLTHTASAEDWPQWRGPNRDGMWTETGILESFLPKGLPVRWHVPVGAGFSGPVVAQGRVYLTDRMKEPQSVERVLCFEEATGKSLWTHSYECDYGELDGIGRWGNGPRATPTVHEGKVYTLGTRGRLLCLDAVNGKVLWEKDLVKDYKARVPRWGFSAAPLVEGDALIVCAAGLPETSVVALQRDTGKELWAALKDRPAYSSPIAIDAGGKRQVIVWTAETVTSFEPSTGHIYWQQKFVVGGSDMALATPVLQDDLLLFASVEGGTIVLKLDPQKPAATQLFAQQTGRICTGMFTPMFIDREHICFWDTNSIFRCYNLAAGKEAWSDRAVEPAHPTLNGKSMFLFTQKGDLILARIGVAGYQEISRSALVEPTISKKGFKAVAWSHPAYANKHVFARNDKELVCASLEAEP